MSKKIMIVAVFVGISLLAGCGTGTGASSANLRATDSSSSGGSSNSSSGGSGSGTTGTPTLTLSPSWPRVVIGGTQQFTTSETNVTWAVNGIPGGNDIVGTISPAGLYTAPAVVPLDPVISIWVTAKGSGSTTYTHANVGALTGNQFAYVSSASDNSIQVFKADVKTGTLQPTSTFTVGTGTAPTELAVAPNGKYLYSLNRGSNDIAIYAIDPATGDLSSAGTVPTPNGPFAMVFSAKGDFAYVSCDGASTIEAYALNLSTGALNPLSGASYAAGAGRVQSLAISPDGKFLYAANRDSNKIIGLAINPVDGGLSPIAGSPFSAQSGLSSIAVAGFLYAGSDNGIEAYDRDSLTGALTYVPTATQTAAGKAPELFRNVSDELLIGVNPQSGIAFNYAFDYLGLPPGGIWPGGPLVSTGTSPVAGAWMWHEGAFVNWVYILNRQSDPSSSTGSIGVYQVDYNKGLVGPTSTIPTALHDPTGFVITP